jgi:hypothetical protein
MNSTNLRWPALLAVVLAASSIPHGRATADESHSANGGGACHAANGALAGKFNRTLHYVTNVGTTDAYLVCHLQMDDDDASGAQSPTHFEVNVSGAPGTSITCIAQLGGYYFGTSQIAASNGKTLAFTEGATWGELAFDHAALGRSFSYIALTLNCKVPLGGRVGLIERWEAPVTPT